MKKTKTAGKQLVKKATKATKTKTAKTKQVKAKTAKVKTAKVKPILKPGANGPGFPVLVNGHTLGELARSTGVSASYMSRLKSGKRVPSLDVLDKLVVATGMTLEQVRAEFAPVGKGGAAKSQGTGVKGKKRVKVAKVAKVVKKTKAKQAKAKKVKLGSVASLARARSSKSGQTKVSLIPSAASAETPVAVSLTEFAAS